MTGIDQKIVAAQIVSDDAERDRLLKQVISDLVHKLDTDGTDPETLYYLGYSHYLLSENSPERSRNIEKYLRMLLELSPESLHGRLFLGHFYYDEEAYDKTLDIFLGLLDSKEKFKDRDQTWRYVKLVELIACCCFFLEKHELFEFYLEEFLDQYMNAEKEYVAIPLEISKVYNFAITSRYEGISDHFGDTMGRLYQLLKDRNFNPMSPTGSTRK